MAPEDVVSKPLRLRVAPPRGFDDEVVAQDFFSDVVGRVLTFGGSRFLEGGNAVLEEVTERLADRRAALHARIALAAPRARPYKLLKVPERPETTLPLAAAPSAKTQFTIAPPDTDSAVEQLSDVLVGKAEQAVETLGHIDYKSSLDELTRVLEESGERGEAAKVQRQLHGTLSARGVLPSVLEGIEARYSRLEKTAARDKVPG